MNLSALTLVLIAFAAAGCLAAAATVKDIDQRVLSVWNRPKDCSFAPSDAVSFHVYLPMHEENAAKDDFQILRELDVALSSQGGLETTSEAEKVSKLVTYFATKRNHMDAVLAWLNHSGCQQSGAFSIACKNIPPSHVNGILGGALLCRYTPVVPAGRTSTINKAKMASTTHIALLPSELEAALLARGMEQHIAHVEGLVLFDHTDVPRRHRQKRKSTKAPADLPPHRAGLSISPNAGMTFNWPTNGRPSLVMLQTFSGDLQPTAMIALVCEDGTAAGYGDTCDVQLISIQVTIAGGASMLMNFQVDEVSCGTAYEMGIETDLVVEDNTVCQMTLNVNLTRYEFISSATVSLWYNESGSEVGHLCGWNNGQYYGGTCESGSTSTYSNPYPSMIKDIQSQYAIPTSVPMSSTMSIGVMEWTSGDDDETFDSSDVVQYMAANNLTYDLTTQLNLTYYFMGCTQDETTLDVDLVSGLVPGAQTYLYSVYVGGTVSPLGGWLEMLEDALGSPSDYPPTVWSVSWTFGDPQYNPQLTEVITARFRLLSLAGVTVVAASGDSGASFSGYDQPFLAFPDASPYCVSVGATAFSELASGFGGITEIACSANDGNVITSGGGYSSMFAAPPFQAHIGSVNARGGRGGPDISALGANIAIFLSGEQELLYGTSAAAPIIASVITLLNAERKNNNKSAIPLIHYLLYNTTLNSGFFTDVVKGDNCATEGNLPLLAFGWYSAGDCYLAQPGWDAVTGLGTPNYPAMLAGAMQWNPVLNAPPAAVLPPPGHTSNDGGWIPGLSVSSSYAVVAGGCVFISVCFTVFFRIMRRRQRFRGTRGQQAAFLAAPAVGQPVNQLQAGGYPAAYGYNYSNVPQPGVQYAQPVPQQQQGY